MNLPQVLVELEATYDRMTGEAGAGKLVTKRASGAVAKFEAISAALRALTGSAPAAKAAPTAKAERAPFTRGLDRIRSRTSTPAATMPPGAMPAADVLEQYEALLKINPAIAGDVWEQSKEEITRARGLRNTLRQMEVKKAQAQQTESFQAQHRRVMGRKN